MSEDIVPSCIHCGGWKCRTCQPQLYASGGEQGDTIEALELDQLRDDWRLMKTALQNVLGTELLSDSVSAAREARAFARTALSKLRRSRR